MLETCSITAFLENAQPKKVREETLDGRKYLVVPTAMIVEGVHNGSHGPVFYAGEDLSAWTTSWNHKPVVVYHPKPGKSGKATASDRDVMEKSQIGIVLNTDYDPSKAKLRTEAWIDVLKADKVDPRILKSIRKGKPMEVSTGLSAELVLNDGEFGGKKYKFRATKLQADHLAVLPDQIGACSIAAGAGLLVTNADGGWDSDDAASQKMAAAMLDRWYKEQAAVAETVVNGMSYQDLSSRVRSALTAACGEPGEMWCGGIVDLYPTTVVYYDEDEMFAVGYTVDKDGNVTLAGDPTPVTRTYRYADATGKIIGNAKTPKEDPMDRKAKIDALIQNGVYAETDRAELEKLPDGVLGKIPTPEKTVTPPPVVTNAVVPPVVPAPAPAPALTFDQLLASANPQMKAMLVNGMNAYAETRKGWVDSILAAPNCVFTADVLNAMDDGILKGMAAMVPAVGPDVDGLSDTAAAYLGMGGTTTGVQNRNSAKGTPPVLKQPGFWKPDGK